MASIQRLKKELSYVTTELLFSCYVTEMSNPTVAVDDITKIAGEITNLYNRTIQKINGYKKLDKNEQKGQKYFVQIRTDLVNSTKEIVEKLESLR